MPEERRGTAPTPAQARGAIRRLENIVATKPFQDAVQNLLDNPEEVKTVKPDPRAYLNTFAANVPDTIEVEVEEASPWSITITWGSFSVTYKS